MYGPLGLLWSFAPYVGCLGWLKLRFLGWEKVGLLGLPKGPLVSIEAQLSLKLDASLRS
jgi:hypothetical protein